jgi:hypothetical protein
MSTINRFIKYLQNLFKQEQILTPEVDTCSLLPKLREEPKVHFETLTIVSKTPSNDDVDSKVFMKVVYKGSPIWALFRCPCGCRTVISLSLQKIHTPKWTVKNNSSGRPSLYPSVWQNKGCCSHFWIKDGRVYWCSNSGIEPWVGSAVRMPRDVV